MLVQSVLRAGVLMATFAACGAPVRGQDTRPMVAVLAVPSRLVFPMEAGSNALLNVRAPVKNVRHVWLSPSRTFPGRVMLVRTGKDTYQVNLAEEIVLRVLQAHTGGKTFRVFAEDDKGEVYASIGIAYKLARRRGGGKVAVSVWTEGKDGVPADTCSWGRYRSARYAGDGKRTAPAWVSPGYTKRIGFRCDAPHQAFFRSGRSKWPMTPFGEDKAYFVLSKEAEKVVCQTRKAQVDYVLDDSGRKGSIELKVIPAKLTLAKGWQDLTISEYGTSTVPGSDGYLRIRVGNIGSQRTLVTMEGSDGRPFIRQTTVRQNSREVFRYEGRPYVLEVTRLHQSIFGSDYVVFSIFPQPVTSRKRSDN